MRALLLAAGKATRLGSLSESTPKCLQPIGSKTILDRLVEQLIAAGVQEFIINTHHLADQVVDYVSHHAESSRFTTIHERELLGTLGTLRAAIPLFNGEPAWVLHADNFIMGPLNVLRVGFDGRPAESWGTMLTFETEHPEDCGVVTVSPDGMVLSFHEKALMPLSHTASAATYIFDQRVFTLVEALPTSATDISRDLLPRLVGRMNVVNEPNGVIDIGTPTGLDNARRVVQKVIPL